MTAVAFTEEMKGFVYFGAADHRQGFERGRAGHTTFMFHLTIAVENFDAFVADSLMEAPAVGWVKVAGLGGRLAVKHGWFNLFAPGSGPGRTTMRYRLHFCDVAGNPYTMVGFKDIGDDPGLDLWSDTTSLYVALLAGHVPPDPAAIGSAAEVGHDVRARGVIVIRPVDFARQLTTFRGRPLDVVRFAALFGQALWRTYSGRSAPVPAPGAPSS